MKRLYVNFSDCEFDVFRGVDNHKPIDIYDVYSAKIIRLINEQKFDICLIGGNFGLTDVEQMDTVESLNDLKVDRIRNSHKTFVVFDEFKDVKFYKNDMLICTRNVYEAFYATKINKENVTFLD